MAGYVMVDEGYNKVEIKIYCHKTTNRGNRGSHISERLGRIRGFEVTEDNIVERIKYFIQTNNDFYDLLMNEIPIGKDFVIEDNIIGIDMPMSMVTYNTEDPFSNKPIFAIELYVKTVWNAVSGYHCKKGKQQCVLSVNKDSTYLYTLEGGRENAVFAEVC